MKSRIVKRLVTSLIASVSFGFLAAEGGMANLSNPSEIAYFCYMINEQGVLINLERMCQPNPIPQSVQAVAEISPQPANVNTGNSGRCDFPWQTDSRGRQCGARAASQRSGGR